MGNFINKTVNEYFDGCSQTAQVMTGISISLSEFKLLLLPNTSGINLTQVSIKINAGISPPERT